MCEGHGLDRVQRAGDVLSAALDQEPGLPRIEAITTLRQAARAALSVLGRIVYDATGEDPWNVTGPRNPEVLTDDPVRDAHLEGDWHRRKGW